MRIISKPEFESIRVFDSSSIRDSAKGFTIIETLVAIAVLMLAVAAPLTMAERSLSSAQIAKREVTAFYLAQEAIEFIRNVKDSNAVFGLGGTSGWLTGLDACRNAAGCGIDPTSPQANTEIISCSAALNSDCLLYQYTGLDAALLGIFGHQTTVGWTATDFKRKAVVTLIDSATSPDKEAKVTVTVSWGEGTPQGRSVSVSSTIFNWYAAP